MPIYAKTPDPPYKIIGNLGSSDFEIRSHSTDLSLRFPANNDIPILLDILNNKANSKFDKSISEASNEELSDIANKWTAVTSPLTHLNFIIWQDNKPIGIAGLGWIGALESGQPGDTGPRAGAAGVMIEPFARRKGYAYDALRIVFDYGLRELHLVQISVGSHSDNESMSALMEFKFGFKAEEQAGGNETDEFGNNLLWVVRS